MPIFKILKFDPAGELEYFDVETDHLSISVIDIKGNNVYISFSAFQNGVSTTPAPFCNIKCGSTGKLFAIYEKYIPEEWKVPLFHWLSHSNFMFSFNKSSNYIVSSFSYCLNIDCIEQALKRNNTIVFFPIMHLSLPISMEITSGYIEVVYDRYIVGQYPFNKNQREGFRLHLNVRKIISSEYHLQTLYKHLNLIIIKDLLLTTNLSANYHISQIRCFNQLNYAFKHWSDRWII